MDAKQVSDALEKAAEESSSDSDEEHRVCFATVEGETRVVPRPRKE